MLYWWKYFQHSWVTRWEWSLLSFFPFSKWYVFFNDYGYFHEFTITTYWRLKNHFIFADISYKFVIILKQILKICTFCMKNLCRKGLFICANVINLQKKWKFYLFASIELLYYEKSESFNYFEVNYLLEGLVKFNNSMEKILSALIKIKLTITLKKILLFNV